MKFLLLFTFRPFVIKKTKGNVLEQIHDPAEVTSLFYQNPHWWHWWSLTELYLASVNNITFLLWLFLRLYTRSVVGYYQGQSDTGIYSKYSTPKHLSYGIATNFGSVDYLDFFLMKLVKVIIIITIGNTCHIKAKSSIIFLLLFIPY